MKIVSSGTLLDMLTPGTVHPMSDAPPSDARLDEQAAVAAETRPRPNPAPVWVAGPGFVAFQNNHLPLTQEEAAAIEYVVMVAIRRYQDNELHSLFPNLAAMHQTTQTERQVRPAGGPGLELVQSVPHPAEGAESTAAEQLSLFDLRPADLAGLDPDS